MTNIVQALISTYVGGSGAAQSGYVTMTFILTQEYEAWVPIVITNPGTTSKSAGAEVELYRSTDYGSTWETEGTFAAAFPNKVAAAEVQRKDILITPGWFLISVQVGGGVASTWTAQAQTAWVITAQE